MCRAYIWRTPPPSWHAPATTCPGRAASSKEGDVALVLSSLVDYRNETAWADRMRVRGVKVGFCGIAASKMPQLFADHADFILNGEPEAGVMRLAQGEIPSGMAVSEQISDLDSLPFPRWDLVTEQRARFGIRWSSRPVGGGYPLLASRGCPEFCTYCPHRILAGYRVRSVANIVDELERLCDQYSRPYVIFRDPLFTEQRERCLELCDEILARDLSLTFEAETRIDRLDIELLDRLHAAGFRAMSFGVESLSPVTLKKSGRRPIPESHQRQIIEHCRTRDIVTAAFYVLGFLQDDWNSIAATIDYAIDLGSTFAQFKILTPYPGTPMFKQLEPLLTETDWERFDGYTPTFKHPHLTARRAAVPARGGLHALLHAAVVPRQFPEDSERIESASWCVAWITVSIITIHARRLPTFHVRLHADSHLALRCASPAKVR